jgi:hypothetical protein
LKQKRPKAFLFGPFLGELSWEFYRFAPYAIYLKKHTPDIKIIVLTRKNRFDLYGKYADILIPLRIANEDIFAQREFGLNGYKTEHYDTIKKYFYEKYNKRFDIVDHFCPLTHGWRRKIRWQFPRDKMSYDFQIQEKPYYDLVNEIIREDDIIVDNEAAGFLFMNDWIEINATDLFKIVDLGVVIESLKVCEYVIGNMKFDLSRLAILLKKPLVSLKEKLSDDRIHLLNPFKTPVIKCKNLNEGVDIYEDNFRSEKGGTGKQRRVIHFNKIS